MSDLGDTADERADDVPSSTRFRFLVSVPDMGDANFDQTVIFMIEHNDAGALGIVVNRPSATDVAEHLPDLTTSVISPPVFFVGGPVAVGGLLALGRRGIDSDDEHLTPLTGPLALVDPEALIEGAVGGLDSVRVFTGYAGWGSGQLEAELASGAWFVVEATTDDVLCPEPGNLWRTIMRRQGGRLASLSLYPDDPSVN